MKTEDLSLQELDAQRLELLSDRQEMGLVGTLLGLVLGLLGSLLGL